MRLLTAVRLLGDPHYNPLNPTGFLAVAFPQENYQTEREGRQYAASQIRIAFYPLTEGTYTLEPVQLQLRTARFGQTKVLSTEAKTVRVLPLPKEGCPAEFTGAVGENFEISAHLDRPALKAGQTTELQVTVKGDGHLDLVPYPHLPNWEGIEKRQLSGKSSLQVLGNGIESMKTYRYRLKMRKVGTHRLKGISLSYFNPSQGRYETVKVPPLTVVVEPGVAATDEAAGGQILSESEQPAGDLGPIVPIQGRVPPSLLWLSGALSLFGLALSTSRRAWFPSLRPSSRGKWRGKPKSLEELERALGEAAPAPDSQSRKEQLRERSLTDAQIARFEHLKTRVSTARFGAGQSSTNLLQDLLKEYEALRKELKL